jgi:predicted enzyme related to lactoylglutathione lyase
MLLIFLEHMPYNWCGLILPVNVAFAIWKGNMRVSQHPIVHIEFPAADPKAVGQFYASVFGWKVETDPGFDYTMFAAEGGPGGGFPKAAEGGPISYKVCEPLVYIGTDDIDASLAQITAHGGKTLTPKTEIPGVG